MLEMRAQIKLEELIRELPDTSKLSTFEWYDLEQKAKELAKQEFAVLA